MKSSNHVLRELTALVASALSAQGRDQEFYRPNDIAGHIAWELFYALHPQGAYLEPAPTGTTRANFVYTDLLRMMDLIDEERNITSNGMQYYRSLLPFYFKSEG